MRHSRKKKRSGGEEAAAARMARKKAQTDHQKEMCAREHARLLLINAEYNKLRLKLGVSSKVSKVTIVRQTISYIRMLEGRIAHASTGADGVSETLVDPTPATSVSSTPPDAVSRAALATPVEPGKQIAAGCCIPQESSNDPNDAGNILSEDYVSPSLPPIAELFRVTPQVGRRYNIMPEISISDDQSQMCSVYDQMPPPTEATEPVSNEQIEKNGFETVTENKNEACVEQAPTAGASPVLGTEDGTPTEPFDALEVALDDSTLPPEQYDLVALMSNDVSLYSFERFLSDAVNSSEDIKTTEDIN